MTKAITNQHTDHDLLPSLRTGSGFALATLPAITTPAVTRDEQHMLAAVEKQKFKMQAIATKTAYAMQKAGELQTCAVQTFAHTNRKFDAVEQGVQGARCEAYVKHYTTFARDQLADQVATLYTLGMGQIQRELVSPLPDTAPPEKGLLTRILGG